jgi:nucleoid DNA-binding protein
MKKTEIARRMAKRIRQTPAAAADRLDNIVHDILTNLRQGQTATLPGLGTLKPDAAGRAVSFERERRKDCGTSEAG